MKDPKQAAKDAVVSLLRDSICRFFPDEFPESPDVIHLDGSGVNPNVFKLSSASGRQYFLKARSLDDSEIAVGDEVQTSGKVAKEIYFSEQCSEAGVPIAKIFPAVIIPPEDLPQELDGVDTPSIRGITRPMMLNLQSFIDGADGHHRFDDHELQIKVHRDLGRVTRLINSNPVKGFGPNFSGKTDSFTQSWEERLAEMDLNRKVQGLIEVGIFSPDEGEILQQILSPIFSFNPIPVLIHTDLNPGNYKYNPDGSIAAVLDAETAEGGPWQYEIALQFVRLESNTFHVPSSVRQERRQEFLTGYGISNQELSENTPVIDGLMATDCISRLFSVYVNRQPPESYTEGRYLDYKEDRFVSGKPAGKPDFICARLGREGILRDLIKQMKTV